MDNFQISVSVPIALAVEHRAGLEQAVHHCLIHNTLLHPPAIELTLRESAEELASSLTSISAGKGQIGSSAAQNR